MIAIIVNKSSVVFFGDFDLRKVGKKLVGIERLDKIPEFF